MRTAGNQEEMTALARAQADRLRVVRRAIKPVIGHEYVDSVPGHKVESGSEMSIRPNQHLQPMQISQRFFLHEGQISDFGVLKALITQAAADLARAEDAVLLRGAGADPFLKKLHVTFDAGELGGQTGLWRGPAHVDQPILDSILAARKTLQANGQYGEYYVIVSPDLYETAYAPPARRGGADAPVYQILPLLANNGFLYSDALEETTGVMFSLARGTISLSVPMDIWVDPSLSNDTEGRPRYKVGEQFRLVIDDDNARVDLPARP